MEAIAQPNPLLLQLLCKARPEPCRSIPVPRMAGIGALLPLPGQAIIDRICPIAIYPDASPNVSGERPVDTGCVALFAL